MQDYDAVVLGSRVQFGVHAKPILAYITKNRAELDQIPSYFFSVSMSAAGSPSRDPEGYLEQLFSVTRWRPREAIAIAGALPFRKYGFLLRQVMKMFSRHAGHATDTSRDHEYTDWAQVGRFATSIAADLGSPRYPAQGGPAVRPQA